MVDPLLLAQPLPSPFYYHPLLQLFSSPFFTLPSPLPPPPLPSQSSQDPYSAEAAAWACTEGGRWVAAPVEGGGIQDDPEETYTCQFRAPSSGILYTPPQYSDHIGVSVLLELGEEEDRRRRGEEPGEGRDDGRKEEEEEFWKNAQKSMKETQPHKTQRKLKDFFGGGGRIEAKERKDGRWGEEEDKLKRKAAEAEEEQDGESPAKKHARVMENEEEEEEEEEKDARREGEGDDGRDSTKLCLSEQRMLELNMCGGGRDGPGRKGRRKESGRGRGSSNASQNIMNFFVKKP